MTISRAQVAHYLDGEFSNLAAAIDQTDNSDGDSGYGADIDNALRALDTAESDLEDAEVEDEDRAAYYALAEYYAARRFWRQLSHLVNHKVGDSTYDYKGMMANAKLLADDAAKTAASLGYDVAPPAIATEIPATVRAKLTPVW